MMNCILSMVAAPFRGEGVGDGKSLNQDDGDCKLFFQISPRIFDGGNLVWADIDSVIIRKKLISDSHAEDCPRGRMMGVWTTNERLFRTPLRQPTSLHHLYIFVTNTDYRHVHSLYVDKRTCFSFAKISCSLSVKNSWKLEYAKSTFGM